MPVNVCVSRPHYWSHIAPVWEALPERMRGAVYVTAGAGVDGEPYRGLRHDRDPCIVAGYPDLVKCRGPVILMEHGAGQSYGGDPVSASNPGYPGGTGRRAALFLSPNEQAAARDRRRYRRARVEVVGMPSVNRYRTTPRAPRGDRPTVCVSTHWPCTVSRESGSGWGHWRRAFADLAAAGDYHVIGHAHPRVFDQVVDAYRSHGIEPVRSIDEVVARADAYCFDNSSSGFELAAAGIPVVVLDVPGWRANVHHGLRFWDCADIGPRIVDPAALPAAVAATLAARPWPGAAERLRAVCPEIADPAGLAAGFIVDTFDRGVLTR